MSSTGPKQRPSQRKQQQQRIDSESNLRFSNTEATNKAGVVGDSSSSSGSKAAQNIDPASQLKLFADERRYAIALPKIETDVDSNISSHPSSPYISPHLESQRRPSFVVGNMEEITLPPLSAAVPMRRGAVSGASSGPLMPFPPIRPPHEEDEIPSRGPSPTLGKRGSFSMGHSNHVPPGPDVQLPTPVLSGSSERRGGLMSIPSYMNGTSHSQYYGGEGSSDSIRGSGSGRLTEEGPNHYHPIPQRHGLPWSQYKATIPRSENAEVAPLYHSFHSSSPPMMSSSSSLRPGQFHDEAHRHYSLARVPIQPSNSRSFEVQNRSSSGGYRYDYHREDGAMSPSSSQSIMPPDSSVSPRMNQEQFANEEHHMHELDSSLNGKRPRSAPRVMSSQPRIFACTQCPARFARNHDLKRHQRGHLSVRPYPCNWCDKSFSRKDALKRHILVKGCGKDGRSGSGGKGEGKGKRNRGEESGNRSSHNAESSGGDQEDGQYGYDEDQDDQVSEENHDGAGEHSRSSSHLQQWEEEGQKVNRRRIEEFDSSKQATYPPLMKSEFRRGSRYNDSMTQYDATAYGGSNSLPGLASLHPRRPSAVV